MIEEGLDLAGARETRSASRTLSILLSDACRSIRTERPLPSYLAVVIKTMYASVLMCDCMYVYI